MNLPKCFQRIATIGYESTLLVFGDLSRFRATVKLSMPCRFQNYRTAAHGGNVVNRWVPMDACIGLIDLKAHQTHGVPINWFIGHGELLSRHAPNNCAPWV